MRIEEETGPEDDESPRVRALEERVASLKDRIAEQDRRYAADVDWRMARLYHFLKIAAVMAGVAAYQAVVG